MKPLLTDYMKYLVHVYTLSLLVKFNKEVSAFIQIITLFAGKICLGSEKMYATRYNHQ